MGREKVELKRIENRASQQVTFSKRCKDLLKKAHELAVLCDVYVGVGVFSERGKVSQYPDPPASLTDLIRRNEAVNTQLQHGTHCTDHQEMIAEIGRLRREYEQLEASLMKYTGEDLSFVASVDELDALEQQIESALSKVRARKDELEFNLNDDELQLQINGSGRHDDAAAAGEETTEEMVELKRIKNRVSRHVTFSKRCKDLLKKAHELAVLCDVYVGVGVFSERGKVSQYPDLPASLTDLTRRYKDVNNMQLLQGTHCTDHQGMIAEIGRLRRECELLEASLMTYTESSVASVDELDELEQQLGSALTKVRARKDELLLNLTEERQLKQTEDIAKAPPQSASSFGCPVKKNVKMAKTILTLLAISPLVVPLAAADRDAYNAAVTAPPPATVPSNTVAALGSVGRTTEDSLFSPKTFGAVTAVLFVVGLACVAYCIWSGLRARQQQQPPPLPVQEHQIQLVRLDEEEEAAAAAAALSRVQRSPFALEEGGGESETDCRLCLCSYQEGQEVAILQCEHKFHLACVAKWFRRKNNCPLCRAVV